MNFENFKSFASYFSKKCIQDFLFAVHSILIRATLSKLLFTQEYQCRMLRNKIIVHVRPIYCVLYKSETDLCAYWLDSKLLVSD